MDLLRGKTIQNRQERYISYTDKSDFQTMFLCGLPKLRQLFGFRRRLSRCDSNIIESSSKPQTSFIDRLDNLSEVAAPAPVERLEPPPLHRTLENNLAELQDDKSR